LPARAVAQAAWNARVLEDRAARRHDPGVAQLRDEGEFAHRREVDILDEASVQERRQESHDECEDSELAS
jgi:hypothetical protein